MNAIRFLSVSKNLVLRTFLSKNCYTLFWRWFCSFQFELATPNYINWKNETFERFL